MYGVLALLTVAAFSRCLITVMSAVIAQQKALLCQLAFLFNIPKAWLMSCAHDVGKLSNVLGQPKTLITIG